MNIGLIEMYFIMVLVIIGIFILRRDANKYAETSNITRLDIGDGKDRREYVASGLNDQDFHGTKILMVLYSLYCRKCGSSDIFVEIAESNEHIQIYCRKCGYTTLIPLKKMIIHEPLSPEMEGLSERDLVKAYIKVLHEKHEVDIVDPLPLQPSESNDPKDAH